MAAAQYCVDVARYNCKICPVLEFYSSILKDDLLCKDIASSDASYSIPTALFWLYSPFIRYEYVQRD